MVVPKKRYANDLAHVEVVSVYDVVGDMELVSDMHHECLISEKANDSGESEIDSLEQEPMCGTCNDIAG